MLYEMTYIILLGNSYEHLLLLQNCIHHLQPSIRTDIADTCTLAGFVRRQCPDMILLYMTTMENVHADYVHGIRNNRLADNIPLFVCRAPLAMPELATLLQVQEKAGNGRMRDL
ncbi:hypothetical protein [Chitinophaga japonensis]|uniref:Response regulatory domain-containing protein n=1 Tax=Chitinophaga japonensis TaxID=104662 RepID=A0A562T436_CHIJA|nr:hypothetical protein [Chitinophaga japonensis]TWI88262.1 hypothetical protein LX66_2347 [Chitinophaga japonensis]